LHESAGGGLAAAITLASPGVAADSNGMFHPLGDHPQSALYVVPGDGTEDFSLRT